MDPEIERLRKKVENYPSPSAYNRLAELLRDNNDPSGVEQICQRSIRDFKRNSSAYIILAQLYLDQGKRAEGTELLQTAVQQDTRCVRGLSLLAQIHESKGDPQTAVHYLQQFLTLKPDDADVITRIAKLSAGINPTQNPAPSGRQDSGTIDMTSMPTALGTGVATSAGANAAANNPLPFDFKPRTSAPIAGAVPASTVAARRPVVAHAPSNPLSALLNEAGVQGVVVSDDQGRVVSSEKITDGSDLYFAALAHEVSASSEEALDFLQQAPMASWAITTDNGQLLAFRRNPSLTLLVHASNDCKIAMIELRARQALIDLGGA